MVSGARTSFPFQTNPIQHPCRPHERLCLHVRVSLGRQSEVRVSRQFL